MSELRHAVDIVVAFVGNHRLSPEDVPELIRTTVAALRGREGDGAAPAEAPAKPTAAAIRKSITPTHLISFINGKGYAMLRRHLADEGLTPDAYRTRFGLPDDYPMTAPSYSARRAEIAKKLGLASIGATSRRERGKAGKGR